MPYAPAQLPGIFTGSERRQRSRTPRPAETPIPREREPGLVLDCDCQASAEQLGAQAPRGFDRLVRAVHRGHEHEQLDELVHDFIPPSWHGLRSGSRHVSSGVERHGSPISSIASTELGAAQCSHADLV